MGDFTKDELTKIKAKEADWKKTAEANSAKHDVEVIENLKSKFGLGKNKDFEPRTTSNGDIDVVDMSAVRSPVSGTGQDVRSLNMGAKSKTPKPSDMMKKGGTVKSASARADGCCIKGKTRA